MLDAQLEIVDFLLMIKKFGNAFRAINIHKMSNQVNGCLRIYFGSYFLEKQPSVFNEHH